MEPSSTLDVYCIEEEGQLAISFVGEGIFDNQVVACGVTFEAFDIARTNDLAEVNLVIPLVEGNALQLRNTEYVEVQCGGIAPLLHHLVRANSPSPLHPYSPLPIFCSLWPCCTKHPKTHRRYWPRLPKY